MSLTKIGAAAAIASKAMRETVPPCIVQMQEFLRDIKPPPISLAQGIVYWNPPEEALEAARDALSQPDIHGYGPAMGYPPLVEALRERLRNECGVSSCPSEHDVMITQGANQAYTNAVLTLLDGQANEVAVLFAPYYFNHAMSITMHGGTDALLVGPSDPVRKFPDLDWLETELRARNQPLLGATTGNAASPEAACSRAESDGTRVAATGALTPPLRPIKMVTIVNPGNPTGLTLPPHELRRISNLCKTYNCWLVVDNTYENFAGGWYGGPSHEIVVGAHVLNVFSFSKAYGMMGWRVGYLLAPSTLMPELAKAQDTIAICAPIMSQVVALGALQAGTKWVDAKVATLQAGHDIVRKALANGLGSENLIDGGTGALYLFAKLPLPTVTSLATRATKVTATSTEAAALTEQMNNDAAAVDPADDLPANTLIDPSTGLVDDLKVVEKLAKDYGICVLPGSACGAPGYIRVGYANLPPNQVPLAASRLEMGLKALLGVPQAS